MFSVLKIPLLASPLRICSMLWLCTDKPPGLKNNGYCHYFLHILLRLMESTHWDRISIGGYICSAAESPAVDSTDASVNMLKVYISEPNKKHYVCSPRHCLPEGFEHLRSWHCIYWHCIYYPTISLLILSSSFEKTRLALTFYLIFK